MQQLRRLVRQRRTRDQAGLFVLEGAGLLAEALATAAPVVDVFLADDRVADGGAAYPVAAAASTAQVWTLPRHVIDSLASTRSPQPVLATVAMAPRDLVGALGPEPTFVVVAAGLAEPGNAGTLVRTAAASGAGAVVFCDDSVDVYNPKAVRASAGAIFRVPVARDVDAAELWPALRERGLAVVGLAGDGERPYDQLDLTGPVALVVGNEAHGLAPAVRSALDEVVHIPMHAGVESLNVSAAAAAVCFEVSRQRRG